MKDRAKTKPKTMPVDEPLPPAVTHWKEPNFSEVAKAHPKPERRPPPDPTRSIPAHEALRRARKLHKPKA